MSLRPYPIYKPSGVEWLGDAPTHWGSSSLKWISKRYSGGTPDKARIEFWEDGTIPWLNSGAVNDVKIVEPSAYITQEAFNSSSAKWIPSGSLVMALAGQGKTKGMVAEVMFETTCNQSMAAIVPSGEISSPYLFWWLTSNYQNIRNMSGGDLRDGLNLELLGAIQCPLPPKDEQALIAGFLDREAAKIDALIAEQKKLLALLVEKRQATISHAVTRGLNPDVPMKDSGVEWLGRVPAHWEVLRIGSISTKITNGYVGPTRDILRDEGVRYLQSLHIKGNRILFNQKYYVDEEWSNEHAKSILEAGDVLIVQTGDIGQVAVVPQEFAGCNCHALIIVAPYRPRISGEWLSLVLNSEYGFHSLLSIQTGALHPHLNCGNVKDLYVPVPPIEEQWDILGFLDEESCRFDALQSEAQRANELLKERRSVLIASAITGKVDVRRVV